MEKKELMEDEDLMKLIIMPLSYRKKDEKEEKICETVKLATQIQDRSQQLFTLAGILVFTDKLIDEETANKIRRTIEMTKVARIFEEEKLQALAEAAKEKELALAKAEEDKKLALAKEKRNLCSKCSRRTTLLKKLLLSFQALQWMRLIQCAGK